MRSRIFWVTILVGLFLPGGSRALGQSTPDNLDPPLPTESRSQNQGLSSIARNRAVYDLSPDDPKSRFPALRDDPLDGSGIPPENRDPFLFPWLMNLIMQDRWRLEDDPIEGQSKRFRRQSNIDIRDPDPDTANFPNGAFTVPKGRAYLETSPLGLYSRNRTRTQPQVYQWEYLFRYGLTDNLEFRVFSNGYTAQSRLGRQPATTGVSPLAFDFKMHFWEENIRYHVPAMGVEIYVQSTFGSPAFNVGTQPSISLLFDQSLPLGIGFEYNFSMSGVENGRGQLAYQFGYQFSFQRQVVKDFDVFFHGFYNAAALPRLVQFENAASGRVPKVSVLGVGAIKTVNDRFSVFGSFNFGIAPDAPKTIALMGFAIAF